MRERAILVIMTEVQASIVNAPLGPVLVSAGAGSGKTRVLTHRIAHLLEVEKIPDWAVMAVTFTNKAASEMRERVERILGVPQGVRLRTFLGTFHSFCASLLRQHIECLDGYDRNFTIYDSNDSMKVIREVLATRELPELSKKGSDSTVNWHLSAMKNEGLTPSEYRKEIEGRDDADDLILAFKHYEDRLRKSNALDFDDLLLKTLEIFEKCPDVLLSLQKKYQYILVDEFQDTNTVQYRIVRALARAHGNIMIVGDEDQCIYTWRGATIANLNRFKADFSPDIYKLEENFRSGKKIVATANDLIQHNTNRIPKVLFSQLEDGEIEYKNHYDERAEATHIVSRIMDGKREGYKYSDFCILIRINSLSRIFEEELKKFAIPYVIWGGFKFYERAEVKQALSYLKYLINPLDGIALGEAVSLPRRGIGEVALSKIKDGKTDALTGKAKEGWSNFTTTIDELRRVLDEGGLVELSNKFLKITGLVQVYKTGAEEDERRIDNLYELMGAISQYAEREPEVTLAEWLQTVSINVGEAEGVNGRVVISTIHGAKGLEFKNVFIAGLEDGIFPLERAKNSLAELEEERRLLYVAITRAMDNLYLSSASKRFFRGESKFQLPSQFLGEIGYEAEESQRNLGDYYGPRSFGAKNWGQKKSNDNSSSSGSWGIKKWW